jgi:glycosyltransferase involved in cell wall biosynthesis
MTTRNFYISSISGESGIDRYSKAFYDRILKPRGYLFIDIDNEVTDIMSLVSSRDRVHFEIGLFQSKAAEVLFRMINAGYHDLRVTLHDPPVLRYPTRQYGNPLLDLLAKANDRYLGGLRMLRASLEKLSRIYVLSRKGMQLMQTTYGLTNVRFMPHLVTGCPGPGNEKKGRHFLYLGFIGPNKGLEYALQVHQQFRSYHPQTEFFVAGTALGKQQKHLEYLKHRYRENVHYLGYVSDHAMPSIMEQTSYALLSFRDYNWYCPVSGSILYCMQHGNIVLTNPVNAVPEIIEDGKNGMFLSGTPRRDCEMLCQVHENHDRLSALRAATRHYLSEHHSAEAVLEHFND